MYVADIDDFTVLINPDTGFDEVPFVEPSRNYNNTQSSIGHFSSYVSTSSAQSSSYACGQYGFSYCDLLEDCIESDDKILTLGEDDIWFAT